MKAPRSHRHLLVRGGVLVTMDGDRRVAHEDVLVTDGRIVAMGRDLAVPPATRLLDAQGLHVLPGLIQGHVHLGQTLFRGLAEERTLLPWLADRIWPLEAAHDEETAYWSTLLGAADCLLSGTTTVQEMGLVRAMEGVFRGIRDSGIRAVAGKCLMDTGEHVPRKLQEEPRKALEEAVQLVRHWQGEARGRIQGALCPRFVLACSRELWEGATETARSLSVPLHTHLLESEAEEAEVRARLKLGQMEFLDAVGALDADLRAAHAVIFGEADRRVLGDRRLALVHCPSANAKLGSGIADLLYLRSHDQIAVGIGCDGAACNNDLDLLEEMRLAAFLQSLEHGPGRFRAQDALEMATIEGARALRLEPELGSLEPGKMADLVILDLRGPRGFAAEEASVYDRLVYSAGREAVRWVVVDGEVLVENGSLPHLDEEALGRKPGEAARAIVSRAQIF